LTSRIVAWCSPPRTHFLVKSGLLSVSGSGRTRTYRVVHRTPSGPGILDAMVLLFREGPLSLGALAHRLGVPEARAHELLGQLRDAGRLGAAALPDGSPGHIVTEYHVPVDSPEGYEAALFDHLSTVIRAICKKLGHERHDALDNTREVEFVGSSDVGCGHGLGRFGWVCSVSHGIRSSARTIAKRGRADDTPEVWGVARKGSGGAPRVTPPQDRGLLPARGPVMVITSGFPIPPFISGSSIPKESSMLVKTLAFLTLLLAAPAALAASDLTTTITVSPSVSQVYSNATYTVRVTNIGNQNASNSTVQISLPATHTSPQVYVLGTLGAKSANCTQAGTKLNCSLGTIIKNGNFKTVFFNIALPVSTTPFVFSATAATTSNENSTTNNTGTRTAVQSYFATVVNALPGAPVTMVNSHCTGTGLTAWMECTFFPSSIASHEALYHSDGSLTIPADASYTGGWTVTVTPSGNRLTFFYDDGGGVVANFTGWGADGACFEGLVTFPGSTEVSPYEVCPL